MNNAKKYQVFISSTYEDLKEERTAVSQSLLDFGCIPVGMEQFPASNMSQMEYISKMLDTCDYYILILAGRYGSIDPFDGIGYTEKEYDYAISHGIPVMSFLYDEIGKLPNEKCEDTDEKRKKLLQFREKVSKSKMIKKYHSKESLQTQVVIALQQCINDYPSVGWVRGEQLQSDFNINAQIEKYLNNHKINNNEIDNLFNDKKVNSNFEIVDNEDGSVSFIMH